MAADWFLARHGRETLGPISAQQLKQMGAAGEVQATDLVWRPGLTKWTPAGQIKGLLTGSGEMPAAPPGPVGAQEVDWRTAGPPREPALPAAEEEAPAFHPEEEAPHLEREPWYYGFLDRYAKYVLGLAGVVGVLGYVWFAVAGVLAAPQAGGAGGAVLAVLLGLLVLIAVLLALVCLAALIRLLVDAARSLRELRRRGDRP
jgi:GYF domain 2